MEGRPLRGPARVTHRKGTGPFLRWATLALLAGILLVALEGSVQPPAVESADPPQFVVSRSGTTSTYIAESYYGGSYTGTLKFVVESAASELHSGGGGEIVFQSGDFDLGGTWWEFYDITDITFRGAGIDLTVIRNDASDASDTEPFDCSRCKRLRIRDLTVSAGFESRQGVWLRQAYETMKIGWAGVAQCNRWLA